MTSDIQLENLCVFYDPKFAGVVKQEQLKDLFEQIKDIDPNQFKDQKWLVIMLPNVRTVPPNFCSVLCRISSHVEQFGLKFSIVAEDKICQVIIKNAVKRMVNIAKTKEEFYEINNIVKKDNVRVFLNTLLDATLTTIKGLLEIENITNEVTVLTDATKAPTIEAGAMAGIISSHFTGNLVIGFTQDVFKKAMSRFLQMEVTEITPEIKDGAAEFLNVIIGQTKLKLNEEGFEIRQVIPSVIMGQKIEISPMKKQSFVSIKCFTEIGEINLLLSTSLSA